MMLLDKSTGCGRYDIVHLRMERLRVREDITTRFLSLRVPKVPALSSRGVKLECELIVKVGRMECVPI
jgi:hypothetical protein